MTGWRNPDRITSIGLIEQADEWAGVPDAEEPDETRWTTRLIHRAARAAAARVIPASAVILEDDMVSAAVSEVGLAIVLDPSIDYWDAVAAGAEGLWALGTATKRHMGRNPTTGQTRPSFAAYWLIEERRFPPPNRSDEGWTLAAVWRDLPDQHRDTLLRVAFDGPPPEGLGRAAWFARIRKARAAALRLWFDEEAPPDMRLLSSRRRSLERVCPSGHEISGANAGYRTARGRRVSYCRACHKAARNQPKGAS